MPIKITGVPPLGFAGQAQQVNASKASHYGVRSKTSTRKRKGTKKKRAGAKRKKTRRKIKPGTAAWMKKIRGMRKKKK